MEKHCKKRTFLLSVMLLLFIFNSGILSAQTDYSMIEEDELFWSRLLSDPAVVNRNELHAARVAYAEKFYDLSIETFNSCIRNNVSNETIKAISDYYIGKTLFILGKYNEAIAKFKQAYGRDLGKYSYIKSAILINAAIAYYKLNNAAQFTSMLNDVIKNPSDNKYKVIAISMLPSDKRMTVEEAAGKRFDPGQEEKEKERQKMMLGFNLGEAFIMGQWGKIYDNTEYFNPFFYYFFNETSGLVVDMEYLSTKVKSESTPYYSSLVMLSGSAGFNFFMRFADIYGVSFSLGLGLARTVITNAGSSSGGGDRNDYVSTSYDPYLNMNAAFTVDFNNIQVKAGISSKTVYFYYFKEWEYENNDLDMIGLFIGVGVRT